MSVDANMHVSEAAVELTLVSGLEEVFGPGRLSPHGLRNILMGGNCIVGLLTDAEADALTMTGLCNIMDGSGLVAAPGFVDVSGVNMHAANHPQSQVHMPDRLLAQMHQHVTGGGGEAGPSSRTPEAKLSEELNAGITTVVGVLVRDLGVQVAILTLGSLH